MSLGLKQWDHDSRLYWFFFGSVGIFAVSLISLYYSMGKITYKIQKMLIIPLSICCVFFSYGIYQSIMGRINYDKQKEATRSRIIQKFKDIRTAQIAFKDANGVFTNDFNELNNFIRNGEIPIYKSIGSVPDSIEGGYAEAMELGLIVKMPEGMTDAEAAAQGLIVRDTVYASVLEERFNTEKELSKRVYPLNIDSLKFSPYKGEFLMKTGKTEVSGAQRPTLLVQETFPFPGTDTLMIGSLNEAHVNGNWKE